MKLIFAQGNPGTQYKGTRHNIGFMALDEFASRHDAIFTLKSKFAAEIAELNIKGEKVLLAKPTTFYNETGQSARALVDFYKLDPSADVLVVHDELALPFGTLRTRGKGSDAGNNGIKSIAQHIGDEVPRVRIGIRNSLADTIDSADFVLSKFSADEQQHLREILSEVTSLIIQFTQDAMSHTTYKHSTDTES